MLSSIFQNSAITQDEFLQDYWQKKPILLKNAIKVKPWLTANELAGACLDGWNSRIVTGNRKDNNWQLKSTPFTDDVFETLGEKDWTLLVQGVDRFVPDIYHLIANFDFIARWKFDDVMMSYAATGGSVGPHFDLYDVFLLQTAGKRKWQLSTKHCIDENYHQDFPLKVMDKFEVETEIIANVGDILYVPPKVAHFGESMDNNCTTLSFGYRSYSGEEIADYCEKPLKNSTHYQDPIWNGKNTALIDENALKSANKLTNITIIEFAEFVTKTDLNDEEILQELEVDEIFDKDKIYILNPCLKIAYTENFKVFIAGTEFEYPLEVQKNIINFCNTREISGLKNITEELFLLGFLQAKIVK